MKVEEECSNFFLIQIKLKYSPNSIFDKLLKIMKNTLALLNNFYKSAFPFCFVPDCRTPGGVSKCQHNFSCLHSIKYWVKLEWQRTVACLKWNETVPFSNRICKCWIFGVKDYCLIFFFFFFFYSYYQRCRWSSDYAITVQFNIITIITKCTIFTLVHFHLVVSHWQERFQILLHHQLSCNWDHLHIIRKWRTKKFFWWKCLFRK